MKKRESNIKRLCVIGVCAVCMTSLAACGNSQLKEQVSLSAEKVESTANILDEGEDDLPIRQTSMAVLSKTTVAGENNLDGAAKSSTIWENTTQDSAVKGSAAKSSTVDSAVKDSAVQNNANQTASAEKSMESNLETQSDMGLNIPGTVAQSGGSVQDIVFPTMETSASNVKLPQFAGGITDLDSNVAAASAAEKKDSIQTELSYIMPGILSTVKFGMSLSEVENILRGSYVNSTYIENVYGTEISVPAMELTDSELFGDYATIKLIFEEQLSVSRLVKISLLFPEQLQQREVAERLLARTFGSVGMTANTADYYVSDTFLNSLSSGELQTLETIYGISREGQFTVDNTSASTWIEELKNGLSAIPLYSATIDYVNDNRYELVLNGEFLSYLYLVNNNEINNYFSKLEAENNKTVSQEITTYHSDDMNYSLTLPKEWYENYIVLKENDNTESFYEKNNFEYGRAYGFLFTIEYYDETMDYSTLPNYKVLGKMGNVTAIMKLPLSENFDVYNQKRVDSYQKLSAGIDDIAQSFRFE